MAHRASWPTGYHGPQGIMALYKRLLKVVQDVFCAFVFYTSHFLALGCVITCRRSVQPVLSLRLLLWCL